MNKEEVLKVAEKIIIRIIMSFIVSIFVMLLWNWLAPTILGLIKINFWQALGLYVLSNLLFRNID